MTMDRSQICHLIDVVKRVDLKSFIEREGPTSCMPSGHNSWKCPCPLHRENNPSMHIKREPNGVWVYKCFGCNSSGTIIDFCKERFNESSVKQAAILAATKEDIKIDERLFSLVYREAQIQDNAIREAELSHFLASQSCRMLLRVCAGDEKIMLWVAKSYASMNKCLESGDIVPSMFESIRNEAAEKTKTIMEARP